MSDNNIKDNHTIININKNVKDSGQEYSSPPSTPPRKYRAVVCPNAPGRNKVPVPNEH